MEDALSQTMPDLVVNVAPPQAHLSINAGLFGLGIAVLFGVKSRFGKQRRFLDQECWERFIR